MGLVEYRAATKALALASRPDQSKAVRDHAAAIAAYARQARDTQLVAQATRIRVMAETRTGELLIEMVANGVRARGRPEKCSPVATLSKLGISRVQSSRWQKLAALQMAHPDRWESRLSRLIKLAVAATEGEHIVIKEARAERQREKAGIRQERINKLAGKTAPLPDKKYVVIYADPEWDFKTWSEKGKDRSAENHYNVSSMPVIKSRPVDLIAADDCVLFLWATVPMLPQALEVMMAWGFFYVSHFVWLKNKIGTGYWNRNKHELLLIGTHGKIPAPLQGTQYESVIAAKVAGRHSTKPKIFLDMIDAHYPDVPKIELNCVGKPRPGWDGWGLEAE